MKGATFTVLIVLVVLCWVAIGDSQKSNPQRGNIYRKYDKKKRQTTIQTEAMLISGASTLYTTDFGIFMFASYTFPGETPSVPETITLHFISSVNPHVFTFDRDLIISADNETLKLGKTEYRARIDESTLGSEVLWKALPKDVFARIANAKRVHVKLGVKEFDLTERHLKNFQALVSSVGH